MIIWIKVGSLAKWLIGPLGIMMAGTIAAFVEGGILTLFLTHPIVATAAMIYVLTAAVTSMRNPWDGFYNWFYRFSHALLAVAQKELEHLNPGLAQVLEQSDPPPSPHQTPLPSAVASAPAVHLSDSQQQ
jgi:hypothetical protein